MTLDEMLLRLEMQALLERYTDCIDSDRLEEWPAFFTDEALYEITPKENEDAGFPIPLLRCDNAAMRRDRVTSLRHANIFAPPLYRHFLNGLVAWEEAGTVLLRCGYLVVNTSPEGDSSIYQTGVYRSRVVQTADGWRFAEKRVIYDTLRVQTLLAYPI